MDLVLFDIDGTLIRSMKDDGECFVTALNEVFGFTDIEEDWSQYEFITDAGILLEVFTERRGRPPSAMEIDRFRSHFVGLLADRFADRRPEEVPGAGQLLAALQAQDDVAVGFATGCWRLSAELKMERAQLPFDEAPSATCDDGISRDQIIQTAIARAVSDHGIESFDSMVYVGDAIWDFWACRRLGLPFVGITADIASSRLHSEGVSFLLPDFLDQDLFHAYRAKACLSGG